MIKNSYKFEKDKVIMDIYYKNNKYECVFDKDDFEKISTLDATWRVKYNVKRNVVSAVCCSKWISGTTKTIFLHRTIIDCPDDKVIDHIDRNPLNNTKENLRVCTRKQNSQNQSKKRYHAGNKPTSHYRGITKFHDQFHLDVGKKKYRFTNEIAAANYYNYLAEKEYGEFAFLNEVDHMSLEECEKYRISREKTKTSKYKGVARRDNRWQANFYNKNTKKVKCIGKYNTEEEAFEAREKYINKLNEGNG